MCPNAGRTRVRATKLLPDVILDVQEGKVKIKHFFRRFGNDVKETLERRQGVSKLFLGCQCLVNASNNWRMGWCTPHFQFSPPFLKARVRVHEHLLTPWPHATAASQFGSRDKLLSQILWLIHVRCCLFLLPCADGRMQLRWGPRAATCVATSLWRTLRGAFSVCKRMRMAWRMWQ